MPTLKRVILHCTNCNVTFVPETKSQKVCTSCRIRGEIEAQVKLRQRKA